MNWKIKLHKNIVKFLKQHPKIEPIFKEFFFNIKKNPYQTLYDIKKINNLENGYRLRIGKYRFIYQLKKDEMLIFVLHANSRGQIYKEINR